MPDTISIIPASGVPLGTGFGASDHLIVSIDGVTRRVPIDALLTAMDEIPAITRNFNLADRVAVESFATTVPAVGTVATHPGAAYRYLGSGTTIPDLPGWAPEDIVKPWHFGAEADGSNDGADALEEAADYCAASEGKLLVIDGTLALGRPVSVRARHVLCRGVIKPTAAFDPGTSGYMVRVGQNMGISGEHWGRHIAEWAFDGLDYCGRAVMTWSPASGAFPATGRNGAPVADKDSFKVTAAGTYGGVTFAEGDLLVATKATPSTTTYAANWIKRKPISMLKVDGLALPFPRITVQGRFCDTVVSVVGNSEKLVIDAAGYSSHDVVYEASEGGNSPDNNRFFVRGSGVGRAYSNAGTVVSDVEIESQVQLQGYDRPHVDIRAGRQTTLSGTLRVPSHSAIYIEQDPSETNTAVQFNGLSVVNPLDSGEPWLMVESARSLFGQVSCKQPYEGVRIREAEGMDLRVHVDDQQSGEMFRLGRTATAQAVRRSRFEFTSVVVDASVTGGRADIISDTVIELHGQQKSFAATTATGSEIRMPVRALTTDSATVTRPVEGLALVYVGDDRAADVTQATSKTTAVTSNGLHGEIVMHDASLAAGATVFFTVNNNRVDEDDHITVNVRGPADKYVAACGTKIDGEFHVAVTNTTGSPQTDPVQITYRIIKG